MDGNTILDRYLPTGWWEEQQARHPLDRQMLFWQLTNPRYAENKKRLIHALEILERVLAMDPLADKKRADFAGKFRDDDQQEDVASELKELVFLSQRSSAIVYAPAFPDKGPDIQCDLVSRPIEIEVTNLSGTGGERKSEGLRSQLDKQLYGVPSGRQISIGVLSIRTQEDLTSTYRKISDWLETVPAKGEYELSSGLRLRVWKTDLEPEHTFVVAHSWRGFGMGDHDEQILRKIRRKAGQLSGVRPGLVVADADLEYSLSFGDAITSRGQSVFQLHPQVSAVIFVMNVVGMPPRTIFRNQWAAHPLEDEEVERLDVVRA